MKRKLKILVANTPADGHFYPLTGIVKYLDEKGHDVRWYASQSYSVSIKNFQIKHYPFKYAKEYLASNVDIYFPERKKIRNPIKKINWDIDNFFIARGPEQYNDIKDIYQNFQFDVLICDAGFTGSVFVKYKLNVPIVVIGVSPLSLNSRDLPPHGLGMTPANSLLGKINQKALRWVATNILFKKSTQNLHTILQRNNIAHHKFSVFDFACKCADVYLQSGSPSFEYKRTDLPNNVHYIGALLPYRKQGLYHKIWFDKRIECYKKIILVTQGTVEKDPNKLLIPTIEAFRGNRDVLIVCTTGDSNGDTMNVLRSRYNEPNIIIENFINFKDIMPYADVYVSNGGYGGVLLAIQHGLPMIVAGLHEGKNEICARIGYFKYGINLKTERPSIRDLRLSVNKVLAEAYFKLNVKSLAQEFSTYNTNGITEKLIIDVVERCKSDSN